MERARSIVSVESPHDRLTRLDGRVARLENYVLVLLVLVGLLCILVMVLGTTVLGVEG